MTRAGLRKMLTDQKKGFRSILKTVEIDYEKQSLKRGSLYGSAENWGNLRCVNLVAFERGFDEAASIRKCELKDPKTEWYAIGYYRSGEKDLGKLHIEGKIKNQNEVEYARELLKRNDFKEVKITDDYRW